MNNILKKIYTIVLILFLGYAQIGCISKESPQNISSYDNLELKESAVNSEEILKTSDAQIHFINTGNSDAILITKDNKAALIDGGDNDDEKLVVSYIKNQGISELEYIFATHPHADHIGGLDAVIDNIKVKKLYVSNGDSDTKSYRDFIVSASNKGLHASVPLLNSEFKLSDSTFKVLSVANSKDPNNNSIVLLYTNGNDKILFTGDLESDIEKDISPGDVDLLKVAHHGSNSSTTRDFIDKITPEYAVILAGEYNKYGHPHVETVELLKEKQIEVHRSDECGDVVFTSTGDGLSTYCKIGSYNPGSNSKSNKNNNYKYISYKTDISSSQDKSNINTKNKIKENSKVVYWSKNGNKYHSDPLCSGMKSPISGTITESGRTPCSRCY